MEREEPAQEAQTESTQAKPTSKRLGPGAALAIVVVALAVRLGVAEDLRHTILYQFPQLDAMEFLRWGRRIAAGDFHLPEYPTHGPGYPFFLGGLLALFDGSLRAVRAAQCLLGALTCLLTAQIAARLWNRVAGIASGLLLALHGPLVMAETAIWEDGLFLFLLTASMWAFVVPVRTPWREALSGLLLGATIVVRPTPLVIFPALIALIVIEKRRKPMLAIAALTFTCAMIVLPAIAAVSRAADTFLLLRGFGAINLYIGNDPAGGGIQNARLGGDWDRLESAPFRDGIIEKGDLEGYYTEKTIERAKADPLGFVGVILSKIVWMTQAEEARDNHSFVFFENASGLLRRLPGFGVLIALASLGLWTAIRRRRVPWVVLAYLLLMGATAVGTLVGMRYRMPIVPSMAILAGLGAAALYEIARARDQRRLMISLACVLAVFAASHVRSHAPTHNLAEELALSASSLEKQGRLDEAERLFVETTEEDPSSALGWDGLGRVRLRRGETAAAREALLEATERDPDFRRAHYHLAIAQEELGDLSGAIDSLRRAVEIGPRYLEAQARLASRLFARGAIDEAEASWKQVLVVAGEDPTAATGLRLIEAVRAAERDEIPTALATLQGVLVEQPRNDAAAQLLLLYADRIGQQADAASWLQTLRSAP